METSPSLKRKRENKDKEEEDIKTSTCKICREKISETTKFNNKDRCDSHPFCTKCIEKYIATRVRRKVFSITCPQVGCREFLELLECEKIIKKKLFEEWSDLLCENALIGLRKCYCPNPSCAELIIDECNQENLKKSECPKCKKSFCFECILPWNVCEEMHKDGSTKHENDILFEELVKSEGWTKCPGCHIHIELIAGCNSVRCRCSTGFCHWCGKHTQAVTGLQRCTCTCRDRHY